MSELTDALAIHDATVELMGEAGMQPNDPTMVLAKYARLVANPNIKAVADALDNGIQGGPHEWCMNEAKRLIALALTPGDK
jgi:hypothetical protein